MAPEVTELRSFTPIINKDGLPESDNHRFRELGESLREPHPPALYTTLRARRAPASTAPRSLRGLCLVAAISPIIDQEHGQPRQRQKRFPSPLFDEVCRNHR